MRKPEDVSQEAWEAVDQWADWYVADPFRSFEETIARAIMAAKAEERRAFADAGCDHDALSSAVGVLRTQQAQPHKSTQSVLWEAIKDYAERAK